MKLTIFLQFPRTSKLQSIVQNVYMYIFISYILFYLTRLTLRNHWSWMSNRLEIRNKKHENKKKKQQKILKAL